MAKQHAAAALLLVVLTVVMTWPLVPNLGRAVSDPGDPYLNIWILDWDWWATFHQPLALFHANQLHPAKYSLAFSENLYGIAFLLFPLRALGVSAIAAHNVAMLLGFAFSGFGAYLLGRKLTGSFAAGLAAGVFYAFLPFRFNHLPHVQHVWGGWLPLLLLALLWYAERPSPRRAAVFGAVFVMNGLANVHYLLFGAFAVGVTALLVVPRRAWRDLALALLASLIVLAPFLYPYAAAAKLYGLHRTYEESYIYSATPSDWLANDAPEPERWLFPGTVPLVMAAFSLLAIRREWPKVTLALMWIAIGFAGSLGMNFEFQRFLFGAVPGFRSIRAPARWAVIAYIGLAILIAVTTAFIARRNRWLALIVPAALIVTLYRGPIRWYLAVPEAPPVYKWLANGKTPVAELPIGDLLTEYRYLFRATEHHRPIVHGPPFTPTVRELAAKWNATPIADDFIDALSKAGVESIIVHADLLGDRAPAAREWLRRELDRGRISYVRDFTGSSGGDWVFALRGGGTRPPRLEAFLRGEPDCGPREFVFIASPGAGETVAGRTLVTGWTSSPHVMRHADIYFNNRSIRFRAPLAPGRCGAHAFFVPFSGRPKEVRELTDVQVDVTDKRGRTISSEPHLFRWNIW